MFREALRIRMVEEKIIELYPSDKIQSPVHLSIGQEAAAVGMCACLDPDDWVFPTYRSHAIFLAKGGNINIMFAELFGKQTGNAKGKAGSMHLTSPDVGVMGASAVVASSIPHAVGAAYASKLKGENRVHVAMFGDGATEEGVYHESLNFAALHKLPVVFFCENNGLAVHSRTEARQSYSLEAQSRLYGIPYSQVEEGYDFVSVAETLRPLVAAVRNGQGPQFVEVNAYRYKEHVGIGEDFHAGYRSIDELEKWQAKDPLINDQHSIDLYRDEIEADILAAVKFADDSPWPGIAELTSDVDIPDPDNIKVSNLDISEDLIGKSTLSYREALMIAMRTAMSTNDRAVVIGQGVDDFKGIFGTTLDLHSEFGALRSFDTPLSEEAVAGITLGMSLNGLYPIQTHIRSDFVLLASNQIINLIAKYRYMFGGLFRVPMLIRAVIGRSWGQGAQHSQSLQSLFAHIPGLTVVMPSCSQSILETYSYVTQHYPGPVLVLEHRLMYDLEFDIDWASLDEKRMPLTSRKVRHGDDVTIVATSIMVLEALRAAKYLEEQSGIQCDIIDLHCISHPDHDMICESVERTGRLIVADTSWIPFGTAAEVCRIVCERAPQALKFPVKTLGMVQTPCPTGKALEDLYYPNLGDLVNAVAILVRGNANHGITLPDERSMSDVYKRFKGPF